MIIRSFVIFAPRPDEVEISGNTYPVKDALCRLQALWNSERRCWATHKSKAAFAWFIVEAGASDGKMKIVLGTGATVKLDLSKQIFCKCQEGLSPERKTDRVFLGERTFRAPVREKVRGL